MSTLRFLSLILAIPALLGAAADVAASSNNVLPDDHPGTQVAMAAAAMDDGFGAFRPSTSFSDLTGLAVPAGADTDAGVTPSIPAAVPPPATATKSKASTKKASGRKRVAATSDGPALKKKVGAKGRAVATSATNTARRPTGAKAAKATATKATARVPKTSAAAQSASQAALKLRKQRALLNAGGTKTANGTPNPLSTPLGSKAVPLTKTAPKSKATTVPSAVILPDVVTSKTGGSGKGDSITLEAAAATAAAAAAAAAASVSTTVPRAVPSSKKAVKGEATTEADFKSVAQAAVTNLILNAGTAKQKADAAASSGRTEPGSFNGKVNISTEHIKALTSSNWVNACGGGEVASAQAAADAKANSRARRQNLTPDERARQNRDRNREHARNTRLRKKAYVEELKRTLTELVSQRDAAELEKRQAAQREIEQREVRFRVMEEFLKLRGKNESNVNRWVAILEEGFSLTLPKTPYRKMVHGRSGTSTEQVLKGASEVVADASCVAALLSALKKESKSTVAMVYRCDRKNFFMDGSSAVLDFSASVVDGSGQVRFINRYVHFCCKHDRHLTSLSRSPMYFQQVTINGLMRAKFSPASNKLVSAEFIFDATNVATQLGHIKTRTSLDKCDEVSAAAAAAQVAAHEADALLDSIQMPALNSVPVAISIGSKHDSHTVTCSESSDESTSDVPCGPSEDVVTRRVSTRQKH